MQNVQQSQNLHPTRFQNQLLSKVREKFGERMDSYDMSAFDEARQYVETVIAHKRALSSESKKQARDYVLDECCGFGPLGPVLRDPQVGNIYVHGINQAYIELRRRGQWYVKPCSLQFKDEAHLMDIIHRVIGPLGGKLSKSSPLFEGTMPNGSRVYATMSPVSALGPTLSLICKEYTSWVELIPFWWTQTCYHSLAPELEQIELDNGDNAVRITSKEMWAGAYLSQFISARSWRGKTFTFGGTAKRLSDDGAQDEQPAMVVVAIETLGRQGRQLKVERQQVDLHGAGKLSTFECQLTVPENAVKIVATIHVRGRIAVEVSGLRSVMSAEQRKGRSPQGLQNLSLDR